MQAQEEQSTFLVIDGQNKGPYTDKEILTFLAGGSVSLDCLAWRRGASAPVALRSLPTFSRPANPFTDAAPPLSFVSPATAPPIPQTSHGVNTAAVALAPPVANTSELPPALDAAGLPKLGNAQPVAASQEDKVFKAKAFWESLGFMAFNFSLFFWNHFHASSGFWTMAWMTVQFVCGASSALYAYNQLSLLPRTGNRYQAHMVALIGVLSAALLIGYEGHNLFNTSQDVNLVRSGHLNFAPNVRVGDALDSFLADSEWEEITAANGHHYVNVNGGITYDNKPAKATLQFLVQRATGEFELSATEINGVGVGNLVGSILLRKALNADVGD